MSRKITYGAVLIFLLISCLTSTLPLIEKHMQSVHRGPLIPKKCFDEYQNWFNTYYPANQKFDITLTLRVRAFGNHADKQTAWANEWLVKCPEWGPIPLGATVPGDPIEVWMDLREDGLGNLMLPPHVIGHEMEQALLAYSKGEMDPNSVQYVLQSTLIPKHCFNLYQEWFTKLYQTDKKIDITMTVRVRAFGQSKEKQMVWDQEWRTKHPYWGPVPAGITVTSNPIEIWMDLRQDRSGRVVVPPHVLGHEMEHAIIVYDNRIQDPHLRLEFYIYERG
jgi:hypothetical protein